MEVPGWNPCFICAGGPYNNCADNLPNSIAVLAAAPRGALLHAPDCYMDKIAAGPALAGHVDLDGEVAWNLEQAAHLLRRNLQRDGARDVGGRGARALRRAARRPRGAGAGAREILGDAGR